MDLLLRTDSLFDIIWILDMGNRLWSSDDSEVRRKRADQVLKSRMR